MKHIIFTFIVSIMVLPSAHADIMKDFDGLGENKDLYDTAKAIHPEMNVTVVQERIVKRRNRIEFAPEFSSVTGGDKYLNTASYGANLHYHINPWVSVGARYSKYSNELTEEAINLINDVDANGVGIIPDIDQPQSSYMALVNVYPVYGKMNSFGMGITHFDLYFTGGYGQMQLRKGNTPTWTAGIGVGLWWSQHFTTRLEYRYQTYDIQRYDGTDSLDTSVAGLQIGYIL